MDQYELDEKIAQARDEGWTTLDLAGSELDPSEDEIDEDEIVYLPPEIGNLPGLKLTIPIDQADEERWPPR